jgi:predicted ferric reductase
LAIIYRILFSKFLVKKWKYKITKIVQLNTWVTEISLEPVIKAMPYQPGQFVFISLDDSAVSREVHPFSIISSPDQTGLQLAVKNLGDYTDKIKNLTIGSEACIEGPFGEFSYLSTFNKKQIWVAGGIGLTPFLGMARDLNFKKENYQVDLYNCVHDEKELIYSEELRAIASQNNNFRVINYCSADQGRITADYLNNITSDLLQTDVFICGPVLMMKNLRRQLIALGLKKGQIRTEEFEL